MWVDQNDLPLGMGSFQYESLRASVSTFWLFLQNILIGQAGALAFPKGTSSQSEGVAQAPGAIGVMTGGRGAELL